MTTLMFGYHRLQPRKSIISLISRGETRYHHPITPWWLSFVPQTMGARPDVLHPQIRGEYKNLRIPPQVPLYTNTTWTTR